MIIFRKLSFYLISRILRAEKNFSNFSQPRTSNGIHMSLSYHRSQFLYSFLDNLFLYLIHFLVGKGAFGRAIYDAECIAHFAFSEFFFILILVSFFNFFDYILRTVTHNLIIVV